MPVSLIGTFVFFPLFGFSINTLSLFGLVLAIGLVVDDAIVVVEAVERHIEEGMSPRDATLQAMREVSGPVIGIALVLSAVFIPTAFLPGITGRLYQQFAANDRDLGHLLRLQRALAQSGALGAAAAPAQENARPARLVFRSVQSRLRQRDARLCELVAARDSKSCAQLRVARRARGRRGTVWIAIAERIPAGRRSGLRLSRAAIARRRFARAHRRRLRARSKTFSAKRPAFKYTTSVVGFSLLSLVQNTYSAFFFVTFKPWSERTKPEEQYTAIKANINKQLAGLTEGLAFAFPPPAIPGVGTSGGFQFILEDRAGKDVAFLAQNLKTFLDAARKRPELATLIPTFLPNVPQVFVNVDRDKVLKQGIDLGQVYQTLQTFMGGFFVNYFNRFGRTWQVYIEAEGDYRTDAKNVGQFYRPQCERRPGAARRHLDASRTSPVRNSRCATTNIAPPKSTARAAPGYSSDQAMNALEEVFRQTMPNEMGYDYLGISYQEKKAQQGVSPTVVFGMSLLFVFLILAALYESWSLPFSVLLGTPDRGLRRVRSRSGCAEWKTTSTRRSAWSCSSAWPRRTPS